MKRRDFLTLIGTVSAMIPGVARAQAPDRTVVEALKTRLSDVVESRLDVETVLPQNIEWTDGFSDGSSCTFEQEQNDFI